MKDFKLLPKLYMRRKTFELDTDIRAESNINDLSHYLLNKNKFINSLDNYTIGLENFWARQYAYYVEFCKKKNKKYSEFLPGRLYTYLLLDDLISRICRRNRISVLEAGCGSALTSCLLSLTGKWALGVDISMSALNFARIIASEFKTQFETVLADCINLPFRNSVFEVVFSLGLFEHKSPKSQKAIFEELARVCKNWIIILIPNQKSPIYQTMQNLEFVKMPGEFVYPEEHFLYEVDFDKISQKSCFYKYESSAIHIVPPEIIPQKYLTKESYNFFSDISSRASIQWKGNVIETWRAVESKVDKDTRASYGWFSYTVYKKNIKK
jgi:SAM-dependent methyltransferase